MDDATPELEALERLSDPEQVRALEEPLSHLEKDTEILLFISPGCAVCPHQLRSLATLVLASPRITLDVVDAAEDPELAARYDVRAVPTTVVDDELIMVGVVHPAELALRLVERQGPEAARLVFTSLLNAGRIADAAERLADGRAAGAFVELWEQSGPEQRRVLRRVAEEARLYDPDVVIPSTEAPASPGPPPPDR